MTHEDHRKKLWIDVVTAVAGAEGCLSKYTPAEWADCALAEFDNRFEEQDIAIEKSDE